MSKITIKQIKPYEIYHFEFDNSYERNMTLLRMQEYFESPKFRNKFFTIEEYMDWYVAEYETGDIFDYTDSILGNNIPGRVVRDFHKKYTMQCGQNCLRDKELKFFEKLIKLDVDLVHEEDYYIIGTSKNCEEKMLKHEIYHGIYYLNKEYHKAVNSVLKRFLSKKLENNLLELGYHKNVIFDEAHAYLTSKMMDGYLMLEKDCKLRDKLKKIQQEYIEEKYL